MSRGRGRGKYTFNLESIGISKTEALPSSSLAPPPLYPPLPIKPVPFSATDDNYVYLHNLKKKLSSDFKSSKYFILPPKVNPGVQRYSDKFAASHDPSTKHDVDSLVDWRVMPEELRPRAKKKSASRKKQIDEGKLQQIFKEAEEKEQVEEKEVNSDHESDEEKGEKDTDDEEEVEEDIEEENDYARDYFDNGEKYGEDSDDNLDEGPIYS